MTVQLESGEQPPDGCATQNLNQSHETPSERHQRKDDGKKKKDDTNGNSCVQYKAAVQTDWGEVRVSKYCIAAYCLLRSKRKVVSGGWLGWGGGVVLLERLKARRKNGVIRCVFWHRQLGGIKKSGERPHGLKPLY